jgi:TolB-like protein
VRAIGEKLGVAHILEKRAQVGRQNSHHRAAGEGVRQVPPLVETYDRTLDDIFAVQDDAKRRGGAQVTLLGRRAPAPQNARA